MKKFKIFSLAVFPLLLGIMAGCSGGTSSSSEKSGSSSSATPSTSTVGPSTSSAEPVSSSSETPTPSSSSSEEPVGEGAAISLNGGELIPMTEYEPGEAGAISGYKIEGIDLTAGESIEFYYYGDLIDLDIGPEPGGCNVDVAGSEELGYTFTIHNDAEGAYVYFKTWDTGGYSFWITGREDPTPGNTGAYLMGMEGDWEIGVSFEPNELNPGEFILADFETNTTDALKVKFVPDEGETVWAGYSQVEEECKSLVASDGTENDNFIFVEESVYTIYYKSSTNTIWIEGGSPVPTNPGCFLMGVEDDWETGINMPFDEKEKTHEQYTYFGSFDNETELKVKFVPEEGETKWCGYGGVEEGCKSLVKQSPVYDHEDGQEPYSDDNFIFEAAGYYNLYYKADTDSIWIAKVETQYGFTMGDNFYPVGTSGNAKYKFDSQNPLPVNAVLGIASKDPAGTVTPLSIDVSKVTFDPADFEFNSSDSTLKVLSSKRFVFSVEFVDGQPVSLVAEQYVAPTTATVTITINYGTEMGQAVYLTGNFNNWSPNVGVIRGVWTEGNNWVFEITQPVGQQVEFKFIINLYDEPTDPAIRWEGDPDRTYTFTVDESVTLSWQP